jgi:hypothetical protein
MDTTQCPNHEGNFDCTPFCSVCEGEQEYNPADTPLTYRAIIARDHHKGMEWQRLWTSEHYSAADTAEKIAVDRLSAYPYGTMAYLTIEKGKGLRELLKIKENK